MINQNFSEIVIILNLIMKKTFYLSIISLILLEIVFLLMWSIGIFLKSEKTIKAGIRFSATIFILITIIIVALILLAKLKERR